MSDSDTNEAYILLERRLVAYLQYLQTSAQSPLDGYAIYGAHDEKNLDNVTSYFSVYAERADTQLYWQGGLEQIDVKMLLVTEAINTPIAVHNRFVRGIRTVFDLRNLPELKAAINATPGFGLSGWQAGRPPLEDGFDAQKRKRQALFRFEAICGLEFP